MVHFVELMLSGGQHFQNISTKIIGAVAVALTDLSFLCHIWAFVKRCLRIYRYDSVDQDPIPGSRSVSLLCAFTGAKSCAKINLPGLFLLRLSLNVDFFPGSDSESAIRRQRRGGDDQPLQNTVGESWKVITNRTTTQKRYMKHKQVCRRGLAGRCLC